MISLEYILIAISVLILLSTLMSKLSENLGIPSLVLFLIIGMLAGSEGPGGIHFRDFGIAQSVSIVALVFILFSGGLELKLKNTAGVIWSGISLSTLGVVITAVTVGVIVHYAFNFSMLESMLLGSIVSSTDFAAVFSVLHSKTVRLKGKLKTLLEFESASNDPTAVVLTVLFIQLIVSTEYSAPSIALFFFLQLVVGFAVGYGFGKGIVLMINKLKFTHDGLYPVLGIAFALLTYGAATFLGGSGFLAAYVAAIVMANSEFIQKRSLTRFFEGLALLSQIVMFLTLGLIVNPSELLPVSWTGFVISGILILLARPLGVFVSLVRSKFAFREKSFISWVGLKGAAPIILATFPLIADVENGIMYFNLVFFITITSALIQGWSVPLAAKYLKVMETQPLRIKMPFKLSEDVAAPAELMDFIVPYNSSIVGKSLAELELPSDSLITLICRSEQYIVPNGSTTLEEGDTLMILVTKENLEVVKKKLSKQKKKQINIKE